MQFLRLASSSVQYIISHPTDTNPAIPPASELLEALLTCERFKVKHVKPRYVPRCSTAVCAWGVSNAYMDTAAVASPVHLKTSLILS